MSVRRNAVIVFTSFAGLLAVAANVEMSPGQDDVDPFVKVIDINGHPTEVPMQYNTIPGAMFISIRTQDLTSEVFTCPSGLSEKDLMLDGNGIRR